MSYCLNCFKNLDAFSPKISLYHNDSSTHKTIISELFTPILIIVSLFCFCICLQEVCTPEPVSTQYSREWMEDAGDYEFTNSPKGLFFFMSLYQKRDPITGKWINEAYDPRYFRFYLTHKITYGLLDKTYKNEDHWIYSSNCPSPSVMHMEPTKTNEIWMKTGICLKWYYDSTTKKYYDIKDPNYKAPHLSLGQANLSYKETIIKIDRCRNYTEENKLLGDCAPEDEIENLLANNTIYLDGNLYDHQPDLNNIKTPSKRHFKILSTGFNDYLASYNTITINPLIINTEQSFVSKKVSKFIAYQNEECSAKYEGSYNKKNLVAEISIILKNNAVIYYRNYNKIITGLSHFVSLFNFFYYFLYSINLFFNYYAVIRDSQKLFFKNKKHYQSKYQKTIRSDFFKNTSSIQNSNKLQLNLKLNINRKSVSKQFNDGPGKLSSKYLLELKNKERFNNIFNNHNKDNGNKKYLSESQNIIIINNINKNKNIDVLDKYAFRDYLKNLFVCVKNQNKNYLILKCRKYILSEQKTFESSIFLELYVNKTLNQDPNIL